MATIENAIVVGDEEDEQEDVTPNEYEPTIHTLMEILNIRNFRRASKMLQSANWDLELALSRALETATNIKKSLLNHQERTMDIQSRSIRQDEKERKLISSKESKNTLHHQSNQNTNNSASLSAQWHDCFQNSPTPFIDPDFSPTRTSLDGRREQTPTTASPKQVLCLCKIPASARKVQSDGPNYGRFFLCCGHSHDRDRGRGLNNKDETVPQKSCNFFAWDKDGSQGSGYKNNARWASLGWHAFLGPDYALYHKQMQPGQVRQGAVGNCWFLSALAVVAEKPYLVEHLFPHKEPNAKGCYQVNLCLDGQWTPTLIDAHLPVTYENDDKKKHSSLSKKDFRGGVALQGGTVMAYPAFCAIPRGQLWPALVEKAYAKAHGCYSNLSGGFIAEGLADLTGAPFETIVLDASSMDNDELWPRLLSFSEAGFLLGVATSQGGDGLVGGHAYSVLNVVEIHDSLVGVQPKVTDFFSAPKTKKLKVETPKQATTNIRLVRIRNPWGKREWKGAWSVNSEQWTSQLRQKLGDSAWAKDDGTFWMSLEDMVDRFHHMDICKTREGWVHSSIAGCFEPRDPLSSSKFAYTIRPTRRSWAFISVIQPKKRANTTTRYWYCDPSMIIVKRPKHSNEEWQTQFATVHGVSRRSDLEVFLDPAFEYRVVPFAGIPWQNGSTYTFRLTCYSSDTVDMQSLPRESFRCHSVVDSLHKELLKDERNLLYSVAPRGALACIQGRGCMYFVGINGSSDHSLSLLLTVELQEGIQIVVGSNGDTHGVPPRSQKVLLVLASSGKVSTATQLSFKYMSDVVQRRSSAEASRNIGMVELAMNINITMAGDLATSDTRSIVKNKGGDTVDTYAWIPQLGRALSPII